MVDIKSRTQFTLIRVTRFESRVVFTWKHRSSEKYILGRREDYLQRLRNSIIRPLVREIPTRGNFAIGVARLEDSALNPRDRAIQDAIGIGPKLAAFIRTHTDLYQDPSGRVDLSQTFQIRGRLQEGSINIEKVEINVNAKGMGALLAIWMAFGNTANVVESAEVIFDLLVNAKDAVIETFGEQGTLDQHSEFPRDPLEILADFEAYIREDEDYARDFHHLIQAIESRKAEDDN